MRMKVAVRLVAFTATFSYCFYDLRHPLPIEINKESSAVPGNNNNNHATTTLESESINFINNTLKGVCSFFSSTNSNAMWKRLQGHILKASYWPERHANNTNFTSWVDQLFINHFNTTAMRKALLQRPDSTEIMSILGVISKRMAYLEDNSLGYQQPLHIFVTGGSVTAGNNCETNPIGLPAADWRRIVVDCPWPIRLQNLFNNALFHGKEVVKVTNLAAGGSSSAIGTVALQYRLFPKDVGEELPHIVVWSHAANDAQEQDLDAVYYQHLPDFVLAARNLRPCEKDLPLVFMFDDSYAFRDYNIINEMTGMIAKVSTWFGLMSASHANVVNHKVWSNYFNSSYIQSLMGTDINLHYGMGFHISASWVILYSLLSAFVDSCQELEFTSNDQSSAAFLLHKKYLPSYKKDGDYKSLLADWQSKQNSTHEYCTNHTSSDKICTYAWMVNQMTDVMSARDVSRMLSGVLKASRGWKAAGNPVRQPRAGYYAEEKNASFTLEIPVDMDTKFMTIMSMKSYGPNFINTTLQAHIRITNSAGTGADDKTTVYSIEGYHSAKTSIHVPHKFELPGGGAKKGEKIMLTVDLVSGAYFKINGIAFCVV